MFVQIIEGQVSDRDGLRRQVDRWSAEVRAAAKGFLGATGGVTDDGKGISVVRFESAAAARANAERPEQSQWWAETEKCYDGDVRFAESEDVDTLLSGGSDRAGFVQIMKDNDVDRDRLAKLDVLFAEHAATFRPDLIGGLRVWTTPRSYVEVGYFTSEAEAREGETREPPAALIAAMSEFQALMANVEFFDLRDPWLM